MEIEIEIEIEMDLHLGKEKGSDDILPPKADKHHLLQAIV